MESKSISVENWLSKEYQNYFEEIKKAVENLYDENQGEDLPHYTPHGIKHCEAVENLIYQITHNPNIDDFRNLNDKERFCLVAAAWLHDIGMLPSVYNRINTPKVSPSPSLIREKHHVTSSQYIVEFYRNCGLKEEDKGVLARICFFHRRRENLDDCEREFIVGSDQGKNVIRLRLLSAYLRFADSLHVDVSRAPIPNYNICLTYSIPPDSKIHWIKSQVVDGIKIDCQEHLITVAFKIPEFHSSKTEQSYEFEDKLESIIRVVMDSLREELNSVMNVLLYYDITYFMDVVPSRQPTPMSRQMRNDLNELVLNYDIMEHPSASKLLEMTIQTIANIAGYNLNYNQVPKSFRDRNKLDFDEVKNIVNKEFLAKLYKDVIRTRPCHKGINNLITSCALIQKNSRTTSEYINKLQKLFDQYKNAADEIRKNAASFFKKQIIEKKSNDEYSIILFGYSQSVLHALCGFRDAIIEDHIPGMPKELSKSPGKKIEETYSNCFRFYICEGAPKTQVGSGNRLLYHDGSQYALALKRNNFSNLLIVPDIIVDNIIENEKDRTLLLMVGANGFDDQCFMHSAGHSSVFKIIKIFNETRKEIKEKARTILVASNHKKEQDGTGGSRSSGKRKDKSDYKENIESCWFWKRDSLEVTRQHIWMPRDEVILKELFDKQIMFFNPREDKISIDELDFIISNVGFHPIINKGIKQQEQNKKRFYTKIVQRNTKDKIELERTQ